MAYQVIYSSQASAPMSLADLEAILVDARAGNRRRGITGALVYVDGVFLQVLEGEKATVKTLMDSIAADTRHGTVTVFHEAEVDAPVFADWTMAFLDATPAQMAEWAGLDGTGSLPEILHGMHADAQRASQVAATILRALGD